MDNRERECISCNLRFCYIAYVICITLLALFAASNLCAQRHHKVTMLPAQTIMVKIPVDLESINKFVAAMVEAERMGLKVEWVAEFDARFDELERAEGIFDKLLDLLSQFGRHAQIAISVDFDELAKIGGDGLPKRMLSATKRVSDAPSIFASQTIKAYGSALKTLSRCFGKRVDVMTVRIPQLDAEVIGDTKDGNPTPYDFWCGDEHARVAFGRHVRGRYLTLRALNEAWKTNYARWEEVGYPMERSSEEWIASPSGMRRHWSDFVGWYGLSFAKFVSEVVRHAREAFPRARLLVKVKRSAVPFVSWLLTVPVRAISGEGGVGVRFDASVSIVEAMLFSSACELYGVEEVCDLGFNGVAWRKPLNVALRGSSAFGFQAFNAALVQPHAISVSLNELQKLLRGIELGDLHIPMGKHLTDVGILLPSTSLLFEPDSQDLFAKCMISLLDLLPYELLDEHLVCDGALENYRMLIAPYGNVFGEGVIRRILDWVERGGMLLAGSDKIWVDVNGSSSIGEKMFAGDVERSVEAMRLLLRAFADAMCVSDIPHHVLKEAYSVLTRRVDEGFVIWFPISAGIKEFALIASDMAFGISGCAPMTNRAISPFLMWKPLTQLSRLDGIAVLLHSSSLSLFNASDVVASISIPVGSGEVKRRLAPGEYSFVSVHSCAGL